MSESWEDVMKSLGAQRDFSNLKVRRYVKMDSHDWRMVKRKIRELFPK